MSTHRATDLGRAHWRKSVRSGASGNCVEVAELPEGHRAVRDSKKPHGSALIFSPAEWTAFAAGVRAGEFD